MPSPDPEKALYDACQDALNALAPQLGLRVGEYVDTDARRIDGGYVVTLTTRDGRSASATVRTEDYQ